MKKLILAVLPIVLLSSCLTQKRCWDRFPIVADTVRIVTIKDTIIYRDTVLSVEIPGTTVIDTVRIPCPPPPPEFLPDTAKAESSLARAEAWFSYPFIRLRLVQKDTTVYFKLDSAIREASHWKNEYEKIVVIKPEKKPVPAVYKLSLWMWVFTIFVIVLRFMVRK